MTKILVTNDDGIDSKGIDVLAEAMEELGDVSIIAPAEEMSAISHALTLHAPLSFKKLSEKSYKIYGTPSDCVYLAVVQILKEKPDLVVSGINNAPNMGDDVTYSGTVAAAIEGTMLGIPSIAFSMMGNPVTEFEKAVPYCQSIARSVLENGLPSDTLLNVNFPEKEILGHKITRLDSRRYAEAITEIKAPRGKLYYWIGGEAPTWENKNGSDYGAITEGYVSITPLHLDLTHYEFIETLNKWNFDS